MCPGIAVLGGGGGGGGKGGKGAGSGGGGTGAAGEGGAGATDGDARGGGSCGAGSPGDCNSCGNNMSAGDPIDVASGRVYTVPELDVALPGPLPLVLYRKYSTKSARHDRGLGYGWSHSLAWRVEVGRRGVEVWDKEGSSTKFPKLDVGDEHIGPGPQGWLLLRRNDGYALEADGVWRLFAQANAASTVWLMTAMEDRNGNRIALSYDENGHLTAITDSVGRVVEATYNNSGRIASFRAKNALTRGAWVVFKRYEYDNHGNLVRSIDAAGHATSYTYDDDHYLTSHQQPGRLKFHFVYDRHHRCTESWGAMDDGTVPGLADGVPKVLADGVTKVKGFMHVRVAYLDDDHREVADAQRVRRVELSDDGQVATIVDGGAVASRLYDDEGFMKGHIDAMQAATLWTRDARGRVIREQDALGNEMIIDRNQFGLPQEARDALGVIVKAEFDSRGNVTSLTRGSGDTHRRRWDKRGLQVEHLLPNGGRRQYEYDQWGNRTQVTQADGGVWQYQHNLFGYCTEQTDPRGARTRFTYDDVGNLIAAHYPSGAVDRREYNATGEVVRTTDPDGRVMSVKYLMGRLLEVKHNDGTSVGYRYDLLGRLVEIHNEKGEVRRNSYNDLGQVTRVDDFDGRILQYKFDLRGRLVSHVNGNAEKTIYERDLLGQIVNITYHDDSEVSFEYDIRGRLTTTRCDEGEFKYEYSGGGQLLRESHNVGGDSFVVEHEYDPLRSQARIATSFGLEHRVDRDPAGRPTRSTFDDGAMVEFTYDQVGRELQRKFMRGGARLERDYGHIGAATRMRVIAPGATTPKRSAEPEWLGPQPTDATVAKAFNYDASAQNLSSRWDASFGSLEYEYDALTQLVATRGEQGNVVEEFSYDATGNMYEVGPGRSRAYDSGNRLIERDGVQMLWDGDGRLIKKVVPTQGGGKREWRYGYDARGNLAHVETPDDRFVDFTYDPFARRLEKIVSEGGGGRIRREVSRTRFLWDKDRVAQEIKRSADAAGDPVVEIRSYAYDGHSGRPLAQRDERRAGGQVDRDAWVYFVNDPIGTPEHLVDAQGKVVGEVARTAFGETSSNDTSLRFQGQYADAETGLHYNRYRYYDPQLGRYISADPAGNLPDTNLYRYCYNSISWTDPLGLAHNALAEFTPAGSNTPVPVNGGNVVTSSYSNEPDNYSRNYNQQNGITPFENLTATNANGNLAHRTSDTEAQVIRELDARHNDPNDPLDLTGGNLTIVGEKPPCSSCHARMADFAQRHNATVDYHWTGDPSAHRIADRTPGSRHYP